MKKCIILANGKPPGKNIIRFLQKRNYKTLICADGGANNLKKLNLIPDYIIGDLDSVKQSVLKYFRNKSEIIKLNRQTDTDVEKCLKFAIKKGFNETVLVGVTGDRLDHTLCNLGIVIKYFNKIKIKLIAEKSVLIPYSGNVLLTTLPGEIISIYAFNKRTRITSAGLKYSLLNARLPFGERESTSNAALSDKVRLRVRNGLIFIIRNFQAARSSDLF